MANRVARDQKIVIPGNECIFLFFLFLTRLCPEHTIRLKPITDR